MKPPKPKVSAPTLAPRRRHPLSRPLVISLLLATVTLAVYWPVTGYDFINLDDQVYVSECPEVTTGLQWVNVRWAFTTVDGGAWHPLTWLSLMLDGQFWGIRPAGYHTTNLLLHVLNTLLLFGWLSQLTGARWRSAIVAALFALHPLHVESVAWVSERKDVLGTAFWLSALWAYTNYVTNRRSASSSRPAAVWAWYLLTLLLFALGLMSKPMLVTLPCVLLLIDFWPLNRFVPRQVTTGWHLLYEKLPFFLVSIVTAFVTVRAQQASDAVASLDWISPAGRVANAVVAYARYLGKTVWPADLAVFYPHPTHWPVGIIVAAAMMLLIISAVAVKTRQRHPFLAMGWLWFLGTLVPVIGLVQVGGQSWADRYTYVPLIGLFIAFVWGAEALFRQGPRTVATAAILTLLAGGVLTARQLPHWRNSETLFRHTLAVTQNNAVAHVNLASTLLDQERFAEAAEQCRLALGIRPDSTDALKNLGLALAGLCQWDDAIAQYQRALEINPRDDKALNSLGLALANQGKLPAAEGCFRRSLESNPDSVEAWGNLGLALALQGHPAQAMDCYRRALKLNPREVKVLNNLGLALASQQRWDEALDYYRQALVINPNYVDALVNSGVALMGQGKASEAIATYRQAYQIKSDRLEVLYNLGIALAGQGQRAEAIKYLSLALRLQPDHAVVQEQLRALGAPGEP